MPKYMLLLRGDEAPELSRGEMEQILAEYIGWARELREAGKLIAGDELNAQHKRITRTGGDLRVTDGPFAETREAVGGYFIIEAEDDADAVDTASRCPGLKRGGTVEMHRIIEHA